ncbi:DUF3800 domain-containing protein [Actinotignum schaalii]|uniref:DUF3800 domain-containing protein n=1 Tax=Actinotignum schaalii TaxID=59505 RepID=UPI00373E5DDC
METGNPRARLYNLHEVEIYCDESGCRGFGPKATPWFGMCAVMVPHESVYQMRATVKGMQAVIGTSKPLHWTEHFSPKKRQERRETIAQMLANIPGITLIYVIADKNTLRASDALKTDGALFYHYVMKLLLERVVNQLDEWPGGTRRGVLSLGSVKGVDHRTSLAYLNKIMRHDRHHNPWNLLCQPPKWISTNEREGVQVADLYMGIFRRAIEHGDTEDGLACLKKIAHQIRRSPRGLAKSYGV